MFYVTISGHFERFQYFNFETDFLENENFLQKNWSAVFELKALRLKTHHFRTKLPYQKPMLPVTTLFFWKLFFSLRTSYKELIWCINDPNANIRVFCKSWNFIWRCFFPLSIVKWYSLNEYHRASLIESFSNWSKFLKVLF